MFQLGSHLHRSRHAVFYFRMVVPRIFRTGRKRPEIRISLATRDPRQARRAALLLWFYLQSHIDTFGIAMAEGKKKKAAFKGEWAELAKRVKDGTMGTPTPAPNNVLSDALLAKLTERILPDGTIELRTDTNDPAELEAFIKVSRARNALSTQTHPPGALTTSLVPQSQGIQYEPGPYDWDAAKKAVGLASALVTRDTPIAKAVISYIRERGQDARTPDTWTAFEMMLRGLAETIGPEKPLGQATGTDFKRWRAALSVMPQNWKKRKDLKSCRTLLEAIDRHEVLPPHQRKYASKTTRDTYISAASGFFGWCGKECIENYASNQWFRTNKEKKESNRIGFTADELRAIFNPVHFAQFERPHEFWLPLLGLFTGTRLKQLCQLKVAAVFKTQIDADAEDRGEIWALDFSKQTAQETAKNEPSQRIVPIHPELIRIGFLEYVDDLKRLGFAELFPYLNPKNMTKVPSRHFNEDYLVRVGVKKYLKDFHCFRHTVRTTLEHRGAKTADINRMVGHENNDSGQRYIDHYGARELARNLLPKYVFSGLDLSQVVYEQRTFDTFLVKNKRPLPRIHKKKFPLAP